MVESPTFFKVCAIDYLEKNCIKKSKDVRGKGKQIFQYVYVFSPPASAKIESFFSLRVVTRAEPKKGTDQLVEKGLGLQGCSPKAN